MSQPSVTADLNPTTSIDLSPPTVLTTHRSLIETFTSFLTVCIHHILFLRRIYPPISFLSTRAYNCPVRQSRHPQVCSWINAAVASVAHQLENNTVEKVSVYIFECAGNRVLERWVIDLHDFPVVERDERDIPFETADNGAGTDAPDATVAMDSADAQDVPLRQPVNLVDLQEQFRALLTRMSTSAGKLRSLPEGPNAPDCSFTLAMEVKDDADRPVGRLEREERKWIAAEPDSFSGGSDRVRSGEGGVDDGDRPANATAKRLEGGTTVPVRRLDAGELRMEVWVEESAAKFEFPSTAGSNEPRVTIPAEAQDQPPISQAAAEAAAAAALPGFDPERGFESELESPDVAKITKRDMAADYRQRH